ncbi:MAG: AAA family ATPase [Euryarchaeota archaeon TMED255]|nr:MAG: AAA family ATPase [Euryarchaeota archaeon TMED255]
MASSDLKELEKWLKSQIVGQASLVQRLIIALLADGHLLVEGAPGLAKTRAIKSLAEGIEADFHRIQFTPDLLPGDITGTEIYRPQDGSFTFQQGPVFNNLVLADEVNRAPAKVQSALLEAMGERQISIGSKTYPLPKLFLVMATQNPIEQEGTYPLPEAQLDRFLLHHTVNYPDASAEKDILRLNRAESVDEPNAPAKKISAESIFTARKEIMAIHMNENVEEYLIQLVLASRNPGNYSNDLKEWIDFGASPRATIALDRCARSLAWLEDVDYVSPDHIQAVAADVLRHRLILSFEAEANGVSTDQVISELLSLVPIG